MENVLNDMLGLKMLRALSEQIIWLYFIFLFFFGKCVWLEVNVLLVTHKSPVSVTGWGRQHGAQWIWIPHKGFTFQSIIWILVLFSCNTVGAYYLPPFLPGALPPIWISWIEFLWLVRGQSFITTYFKMIVFFTDLHPSWWMCLIHQYSWW